jgi:hypothetical protein
MITGKLKRYKSPSIEQIPPEIIQEVNTLLPEIHFEYGRTATAVERIYYCTYL